jgi:exopolyphosphatase/guanosine-5'-triphosphate,3'-diphosphate pyrophosphatase
MADPGTVIIPRWEWRTFGDRFDPEVGAAFAALTPTGVQESDELYLLGGADAATVKVRFDLMDVKALREVAPSGLQRWEPTMKASFPMAAADVRSVAAALGLGAPDLRRDTYTLDEFLAEVTGPSGAVRPVQVHKRRVRYVVNGCTAEVSDVVADGHTTRTIAIEDPDPVAVLTGVDSVGLGGFVNTSYPSGLAALLDGRPPRFAVIDVGTNSVKFNVSERQADGTFRTVVDRAEITRLGEGLVDGGDVQPAARDRTLAAIAGMVEEARRLGTRAIVAVGTAAMRAAHDQAELVAAFEAGTGIRVQVISGEEEARLAYVATVAGLGLADAPAAVFDTGGGSSQFTFGHGRHVDEQFSVPLGAVRLTERFGLDGAVGEDVIGAARSYIADEFAALRDHDRPAGLVGMGGAMTNLAAVKHELATYDPEVVQGTVLGREEIDREIELYRTRDADARRAIVGLQPARAEVILAGALVVRTIMDLLDQPSVTVSDRGLRHGLLAERFDAELGTPSAAPA